MQIIENHSLNQVFILCSIYLACVGTLGFLVNSFVILLFIKYKKVIDHSQKYCQS